MVLDASVLANAVGDDAEDGRRMRDLLRGQARLAAPDLVDVETTAVLRRRWLTGSITDERFGQAVIDLADMPITRYPALGLLDRVFELRADVTAYGACYVALAEALGWPLLTADRRLAGSTGPRCRFQLVSVTA